jgi:NAD+ diphosphatase
MTRHFCYFSHPAHLPFNSTCLRGRFLPATADRDPGGDGVWLLLRGEELLLRHNGDVPELPRGALPGLNPREAQALFIGTWDGRPCRLLDVAGLSHLPDGLQAHALFDWDISLPVELLSLAGTAGQILHWERNSRFCSRCGEKLVRLPGEWGKRCRGCGALHFPHIHPCVITIVRRPGEVLLTRKAEWPEGRYSLVAGFVNFGECLEEAAAREIAEETGVRVRNLRYIGSQCWPFPSQLMAGFSAEYDGGELVVDYGELADARWFPVDALPPLPPPRSIARYLLDHHLNL